MTQYNIVFDVADDFDPDALQIGYTEGSDKLEVAYEGFVNFEDEMRDKITVNSVEVGSGRVAVVKVSSDHPADDLPDLMQSALKITEAVTECPCLVFLDDIEVLTMNAEEAITMLNGMINKIKVRCSIKDPSIVIPGR